jgi:hypothetical protein
MELITLITQQGDHPREKIFRNFFLKMTPLGVKICRESKFDIFEVKKRFPDTGKAYCVLKRKVAKMRLLPKNDGSS